MSVWLWIAVAAIVLYALFVLALMLTGRRTQARAVAGFVPDCAVLFKRLAADPRLQRRHKVAVVLLTGYLVMPLDLVPDFIPVAGQLDDAVLVALVLRWVLRGGGEELVRAHWPGPVSSLAVLLRMAGLAGEPSAA
ncbi:MAG: hypothetical protein QOC95_1802 [Thermoleophilaceae bacterium]|nr:hypothetical protein [Thermoleophilaceae bacterium]